MGYAINNNISLSIVEKIEENFVYYKYSKEAVDDNLLNRLFKA